MNGHKNSGRFLPLLGLLLYYAAVIGVAGALVRGVPGFRDALLASIAQASPGDLSDLTSRPAEATPVASPWGGLYGRGLLALVAMAWALVLVLPVAWVLMRTRRLRYDPSLVHTIIALPLVVAGVVLVVKNSLALAFALAGIVAGVRFRQKLEQPEEAVYVLLALGIGLAAGVQALDVALVMSMAFTIVVFTFWRFDIGAINARGRGAQLRMGEATLLPAADRATARDAFLRQAVSANGLRPDGVLIVEAGDREAASLAVESLLGRLAAAWRVSESGPPNGPVRIEALLRLRPDADPAQLIAELEARWSDQISAAEYVPLGNADATS